MIPDPDGSFYTLFPKNLIHVSSFILNTYLSALKNF